MDNDKSELRWRVAQRLEFIEFRLFWEGHVNRSDLMEQFGLSVNQASADLNRYIGFVPDNMVHDRSARTYVRGPDYAPHFLKPDASRYLAQRRPVADGIMDSDDFWIAALPSYDAAPTPARGVKPVTLRSIVGASVGKPRKTRAIIVYPMNALANSQMKEIDKFISQSGLLANLKPVVKRYTGQESEEERQKIAANPPDILLTNYMMAELLLTRQNDLDSRVIANASGLEFIVLEELHNQTGDKTATPSALKIALRTTKSRGIFPQSVTERHSLI